MFHPSEKEEIKITGGGSAGQFVFVANKLVDEYDSSPSNSYIMIKLPFDRMR
jgi:hypothetical protein